MCVCGCCGDGKLQHVLYISATQISTQLTRATQILSRMSFIPWIKFEFTYVHRQMSQ